METERMQKQNKKIKLGEKEKELIKFLIERGKSAWKEDVINNFAYANKYEAVVAKRLKKLEEKGFIEVREEINPETGRKKQKVYLKE